MATQVKLRQLHEQVTQKWDDNAAAIAENAGAITAEQTRAEAAEGVLTTNLAAEVTNREAAVTAEAAARSSADTTLQSNIDSEASTRASADSSLQDSITAEVNRATAAESTLTTNLAQEVTDRGAAVTAEASARSSADAALQSSIDAEVSARAAADTALESSLKGEATDSFNTLGKVEDELLIERGRVNAILDAADADKDSFAEIVSLINSVDTENDEAFAAYVLSNNAAVTALQADVDQNESDADAAIAAVASDLSDYQTSNNAALAAEISRAQTAEATIQADVDQNEADCDAGLASASTDRAAIRSEFAAGDSALQSNIDGEATSRAAEDVILMNSLESMGFHQGSFAGSDEMPLGENFVNIFPGSLSVFINGLEAESEQDYSESGGAIIVEGVASDDRVSFRYMYKSFESLSGNDDGGAGDEGGGEDLGGGDEGGDEGGGEGEGPLLADQSQPYQNGWYAAAAGDERVAVVMNPDDEGAWLDGYDAYFADPDQYSDYTP